MILWVPDTASTVSARAVIP